MSAWTFLQQFLREPDRIGSVIPSSGPLCDRVIEVADVSPGQVVIELGAGTGPVTRRLVAHHPDATLIAMEPTPALARVLQERLPDVDVEPSFADRHLRQHLEARGVSQADRVVSGLPWTMWPEAQQEDVLEGIVDVLADDGRFLTYTYVSSQLRPSGAAFRQVLSRWFGRVWRSEVVWGNLPPAVVVVGEEPRCPAA